MSARSTGTFHTAGSAEQCHAELSALAQRIGQPGLARIEDCLVAALNCREGNRRWWVQLALQEVRKLKGREARRTTDG